jgi:signal peptidase II
MKKFHNIQAILIAIVVLILDQIIKFIFRVVMAVGDSSPVIPKILSFTLVHNKGAGFGIFQNQRVFFIIFSLIVVGCVAYYWKKIPSEKNIWIPLGLILGGLFGNLLDRIIYGYVVDFIDFGFWPVFNVADSCISIGSIWLIIYLWGRK